MHVTQSNQKFTILFIFTVALHMNSIRIAIKKRVTFVGHSFGSQNRWINIEHFLFYCYLECDRKTCCDFLASIENKWHLPLIHCPEIVRIENLEIDGESNILLKLLSWKKLFSKIKEEKYCLNYGCYHAHRLFGLKLRNLVILGRV